MELESGKAFRAYDVLKGFTAGDEIGRTVFDPYLWGAAQGVIV